MQSNGGPAPAPDLTWLRSWASLAVVLVVWAGMLATALDFVGRYGSNVPLNDDWDLLPQLVGAEPVTTGWLWHAVHGQQRVAVGKGIVTPLLYLTRDFRSGMVWNVLALAALALALAGAAARVRGRPSCLDAFFPLVLLHLGHAHNFLWFMTVTYLVTISLSGALLVVIVRGPEVSFAAAVLGGLCVILLPLCGAHGWVFALLMIPWLVYVAGRRWRRARGQCLVLLALAAVALVPTAAYWVGYQKPAYVPESATLSVAAGAALKVLGMGLGPAGQVWWPWSGLALMTLVLFAGALLLLELCRWDAAERPRTIGLGLFLVGAAGLVAGVGWGRFAEAQDIKLVTFSVPLLACLFFVLQLYGPRARALIGWPLGLITGQVLARAAIVFVLLNAERAVQYGKDHRFPREILENELAKGLAEHHVMRFFAWLGISEGKLPLLHKAGIGQFKHMRPDPPLHELHVATTPSASHQVKFQGRTGRSAGKDAYLEFVLPDPVYVYGIRVTFSHEGDAEYPTFQVFWKPLGGNFPAHTNPEDDSEEQSAHRHIVPPAAFALDPRPYPQEWPLSFWVGATVTAVRIYPDQHPCTFRITELVLLTAAE